MSARAASRLVGLGFANVHRYQAGKADWFAAGLRPAITDIEQPCLRGRSHHRLIQGPAVADIKGPLL